MKLVRWIGIVAVGYLALVVAFEAIFLGYLQPEARNFGLPMIVIETTESSGASSHRRVAVFEMDGNLYVSAHHWPRGWYHNAVANPEVRVERDGDVADYFAVAVDGEEFERVAAGFPLSFPVRFVMGFPPKRDILRLDPVASENGRI